MNTPAVAETAAVQTQINTPKVSALTVVSSPIYRRRRRRGRRREEED